MKKIDVIGKRFNRWTVLSEDDAIQKLNELEIKYFGATREGYV